MYLQIRRMLLCGELLIYVFVRGTWHAGCACDLHTAEIAQLPIVIDV